jgi:hypothetical protein
MPAPSEVAERDMFLAQLLRRGRRDAHRLRTLKSLMTLDAPTRATGSGKETWEDTR